MIDKATIKRRFKRSIDTYDENATVQKMIVNHLFSLLGKYTQQLQTANMLEVGCGTGLLTRKLQEQFSYTHLDVNDLVEDMCSKTASTLPLPASACLIGDIETITLERIYDLVVSASTFQWFNAPEVTLKKLAGQIRERGFLIFSTFGDENLTELRTLTGQGLVYHASGQWEKWLSADFELLHVEERQHILYFQDPLEVLLHVKRTGANATATPYSWTKSKIQQFCKGYDQLVNDRHTYPLTYHPMYFVCRKK